jgi:hypothetical protein
MGTTMAGKPVLETTSAPIRSLIDRIDLGEIRLPEIQRAYVWKPAQVAGLLDSLYRSYPSGSLLLWAADEPVESRTPSLIPSGNRPIAPQPQYLLDGQQRLTSLHRVFTNHAAAQVVFNVESERFQIASAATKNDPRWVNVPELLALSGTYAKVKELDAKIPEIDPDELHRRLERVRQIADYKYHIEVVRNRSYDEVTDIFVRVNSRGRPLKTTDLALATLSARWPGVIAKFEEEKAKWAAEWPAIDEGFLVRCVAAIGTTSNELPGLAKTPTESIANAWNATKHGLNHLIPLLQQNAGIGSSQLLPSSNALVPLVAFLGTRPDEALDAQAADALLYWLFGAFITGRYSQSVDTHIAQDAKAVLGPDPIKALVANLGLFGGRLEVTESALTGKGAGSPLFLLSYLVAKRNGARDWYNAVEICTNAQGAFALEYHHIHPKATLQQSFSKDEINDLSNLAFISGKANRKIGGRSPAGYFPEIGDEELARHFVPTEPDVRTADRFPEFIRRRRAALAVAMTEFLEHFRPVWVDAATTTSGTVGRLVARAVVGGAQPAEPVLELAAVDAGAAWTGVLSVPELVAMIDDVENGRRGQVTVGEDPVVVEAAGGTIELPLGPFVVTGTPAAWRALLNRELAEAVTDHVAPEIRADAWAGERQPILAAEVE